MATQEIGIILDLSNGIFTNTQYVEGKLQLVNVGLDGDENIIFASKGDWESETMLIKDKVASFKNVVKTIIVSGNATTKVYTKSSDDGFVWTDYVSTNDDGSINSPAKKYARIKIEIIAGFVDANFYIDKFEDSDKYSNDFMNFGNGELSLKKDYTYQMENNIEFVGVGKIFSRKVPKSKFKKLNSIQIN
ncbi:hypothetical protein BSK59_15395 [Paenibacillus odorifer]|uniref:hypothetical protein n=1 Tax=Paenibacillus odorifer TaxID=189426 RepID=UPI00096F7506|nr:hypothetical protein [Paenibacillus odorifer]OME53964.1 hypothetical protein BSK59_15395 [Paenibacillus odorifer]